jgi:hypothetical protein
MTETTKNEKSDKMVKMEELRKQLADLESGGYAPDMPKSNKHSEEGSETSISDDEVVEKPKRKRTEKQKQAFIKAQETRLAKAEERKKEKALKEQEEKKELEKKLIEKAIKVKKKQIKKMAVIEQLSDDDTPIEKLKPKKVEFQQPKYVESKLKFV